MDKKIATYEDGSVVYTIGDVSVSLGKQQAQPTKVEEVTDISDNDFEQAVKQPKKYKIDLTTRKVRLRKKNEKRQD